jgi:ADP-heptose:LPS heptosyltransferase
MLIEKPKKILAPRLDTIGDIILFEGFLEALLSRYPETEIVLVVQEKNVQLKPLFPDRIRWLTFQAHPYTDPDENELGILLNALSQEQWDLILTTTFNRTYIDESIALKFKNVRNIAIGGERHISWMLKKIWRDLGIKEETLNYEFVQAEEFSHETEKYRNLWTYLTDEDTLPLSCLHITSDLAKDAHNILSSMGIKEKAFCICNPAGIANITIKTWPEERFAEVIAWTENKYNLHTLITGHEKESELIEKVVNLAKKKGANPLIWLGKDGDIPLLAAITQKARFYVGNDTGSMHIAGAVKIPVVGIFGGGTFPRFLPAGNSALGVVGDLPCFKCYWNCIFGDAPCIRLVDIQDVQHAVDTVLTDRIAGSKILYSSRKISDESSKYVEKAKKTFEVLQSRLKNNLELCEEDRAARLEVINSQAQAFGNQLNESEKDRVNRLEIIQNQGSQIANLQKTLGEQQNNLHEYKEISKQACEKLYKTEGNLQFLSKFFTTQKIDFGTDDSSFFLHSGWGQNETLADEGCTVNWAMGKSASLFLALPKEKPVQMTVNVKAFSFPTPQIITIRIDGKEIGKWTLTNKWQWEQHSMQINPDNERKDVSIIGFVFSQNMTIDNRALAVLFESLSLHNIDEERAINDNATG